MLTFKEFINEKINVSDDISISIENVDKEYVTYLVDKFSFLIMKRATKVLRPISITGKVKSPEDKEIRTVLNIIMNNNDHIITTYSNGNLAISINNEIIYDVDRDNFDDKLVDKIQEEYVKYLKSKRYLVKRNN